MGTINEFAMNDLVIISPTRMQPSDYLRLIASILVGLIWVAWRKKTRPPALKAHSAVVNAPVNIQRPIMTPSDISELEKKYLENPQKNYADVLISLMGGIPNSEVKELYPESAVRLLSRVITG